MAKDTSLADENLLLQSELSKVEDLLSATRAERDEIGSKYSALSDRVSFLDLILIISCVDVPRDTTD